ncbi:MAG: penicillin-binding transpeptidase domain-containing protein [Chloroflexota bacterium]
MHSTVIARSHLRAARAFGVWCVALILLTGCGLMPGASMAGSSPQSAAILPQMASSPAEIVEQFLNAWNERDYRTMYTLLSTESQGQYTYAVFETTYNNVAEAISLEGISFSLGETELQGRTAAVHYDVTLRSPSFGAIEDAGRIMRLVEGPAGWRIAWSTMDIFDGLAAGARIQVDSDPPPRGHIFDRNGNYLVEENGVILQIYAQKLIMANEEQCYRALGTALRRDYREIAESAANYNPETIFFVGDMDREEYETRAGMLREWCGIDLESGHITERIDRRYVGHGAATHVTGYLGQASEEAIARGVPPGTLIGQAGVEGAFDAQLRGEAVRVLRITEPGGTVIRDLGGAEGQPAQNVTLTIDRDLQIATAQALYDAFMYAENNWASRSPGAGAVILDVKTGAILALASYPTFDPGLFSPNTPFPFPSAYLQSRPNEPFFNRVTQGQYPPGSVFKIVTTAAVANEGLMDPDDTFYCGLRWENGPLYGDSLPVRLDWRASEPDPEQVFPTGDVTMSGALTSSCDPFYYEMGARLFQRNPALLSNYARRMGLGQRFGLEPIFPEASGFIPTTTSVEQAINEAIGQGDLQFPVIQMANLVASVANGGTIYRPYIVERVGHPDQPPTFVAEPQVIGTMDLSEEALEVVRQGMCDVTTQEKVNTTNGRPLGTAWFVFENTYYSICGKTGTSQTNAEPHAWFVAYVPADRPQIAIAVMVQNSREGSEVAAPIVRRILDDYLNVPPENFWRFPDWWQNEYVPLTIAEGGTGGG